MTSNGRPRRTGKRPPPIPSAPIPSARPPTPTELWYLEALRKLTIHYGRLPKITEFAAYCDRALFPTYSALRSLERKGRVRRVECGEGPTRKRFEIVEVTK